MTQTGKIQILIQKLKDFLPEAVVSTGIQDVGIAVNVANTIEYGKAVKTAEEFKDELRRLAEAAEVLAEIRDEMRRMGVFTSNKIRNIWVCGSFEVTLHLFLESEPFWAVWIRYTEVGRMPYGKVEVKGIAGGKFETLMQKEFADIKELPKIIEEVAKIVSGA